VTTPVLLGLAGGRGSGKDTAADRVRSWCVGRDLSFCRRSFADKIKHSAALALGFEVAESDAVVIMDSLKELGEITTVIPNQSVAYTIDGRTFLQRYGTESHRDLFGYDFWVHALLPNSSDEETKWHSNFLNADVCVIADVRFENEAERIRKLGGQVWQIIREAEHEDSHISEVGIPASLVDLIIPNNGTLEQFHDEIEMCCNSYLRKLVC
jgi:hypothetical protein